jgi:hypothetical protein
LVVTKLRFVTRAARFAGRSHLRQLPKPHQLFLARAAALEDA